MFVIIWEYLVPPDQTDAFDQIYGGGGDWAKLFSSRPSPLPSALVYHPPIP